MVEVVVGLIDSTEALKSEVIFIQVRVRFLFGNQVNTFKVGLTKDVCGCKSIEDNSNDFLNIKKIKLNSS